MTSPLPGEHEFDSPGIDKLRDSAVDAIAWALIDNSMDTADRQPSEEAYRAAVEQARALLPTLVRRSVVSTPSEEVRAMIEEALVTLKSPHPGSTVREGSRVGPYDFQRANEEARRILRDALETSAVSAPPTITDEMADRAQIAMHEFCFGDGEPPTRRQLGIARQGWKVAIAAALGGEA